MKNNYSKLRGRIVERYGTLAAFAEAIGISRASVANKFSGKNGFTRKSITIWGTALDIDITDPVQVAEFFLT